MFQFLVQLFPTAIILGLLIFVHELGHFLACRLSGVGVEKFSIGFGPELMVWQGKETRYSLSLIPFGGFVKPQGESDEEIQKRGGESQKGDFISAPILSRIFVIVSGVFMNYLLAYVLFVWVFCLGRSVLHPVIGGLIEGYPAQTSGFQIGDRVISVNEKPVGNWQDLTYQISKSVTVPILFSVIRGGESQTILVQPKFEVGKNVLGATQKVPRIGIMPSPDAYSIERYNLKVSLVKAWQLEFHLALLTYEALGQLVTGRLSFKTISGPIGIVAMAGNALKMGLEAVLQLTALLSVSLAVINLLPIPALDGGHLLFMIPELIFRKKIPIFIQERITQFGFYFLIVLMVLVVFNDLSNLGMFEKLKSIFIPQTVLLPK